MTTSNEIDRAKKRIRKYYRWLCKTTAHLDPASVDITIDTEDDVMFEDMTPHKHKGGKLSALIFKEVERLQSEGIDVDNPEFLASVEINPAELQEVMGKVVSSEFELTSDYSTYPEPVLRRFHLSKEEIEDIQNHLDHEMDLQTSAMYYALNYNPDGSVSDGPFKLSEFYNKRFGLNS